MTTPIYLAACMSAVSILCTATLLRASGQDSRHAFDERGKALDWRTYTKYFGRPALRMRLTQFLCFITAFSLFVSGFALFAERRFVWNGHPFGPREIGYVFGYVGLLGILLQGGLIGRLVRWLGEGRLVALGFLALFVGYAGLGAATSTAWLLAAGTAAAFGNGAIRPALTSLITQEAGPREQGVVLGITQSLMSLASVVAPIIAGVLIGRGHLAAWAWTAAALAGLGIVLTRRALSA
jgi:predicted MFS family arabinose efflux permease